MIFSFNFLGLGKKKFKPQELCRLLAKDLAALCSLDARPLPRSSSLDYSSSLFEKDDTLGRATTYASARPYHGERERGRKKVDCQKYAALDTWLVSAAAPPVRGREGGRPKQEELEKVMAAVRDSDLLKHLVEALPYSDPGTLRLISSVWGSLLRLPKTATMTSSEYLLGRPSVLRQLVVSYQSSQLFMISGDMLRDCIASSALAETILQSELIAEIFDALNCPNADLTTDAFQTLRELLLRHPSLSSRYLVSNYGPFFGPVQALLKSDYMTLRQTLKLLAEILLDRAFMKVMLLFVNDEQQLMSIMRLLSHPKKSIQYEAFHVFKIFAANPRKAHKVHRLLFQNREKVIKLLHQMAEDKKGKEDTTFMTDKVTVVFKLENLPAPEIKKKSPKKKPDSDLSSSEGALPPSLPSFLPPSRGEGEGGKGKGEGLVPVAL